MTEYYQKFNFNQEFYDNNSNNMEKYRNFTYGRKEEVEKDENTPTYHPSISILKELVIILENEYKKYFETLNEIHKKKIDLNDNFTNFEIIEELRDMVRKIKQIFRIILGDIKKSKK